MPTPSGAQTQTWDQLVDHLATVDWGLVVALIALFVSLYSLKRTARQGELELEPRLNGHEVDTPHEYSYSVVNKGTGPALVSKISYSYAGTMLPPQGFKDKVAEVLDASGLAHQLTTSIPGSSTTIAAGDGVEFVRVQFNPSQYDERKKIDVSQFLIEIEYESSHGKKNGVFDRRLDPGSNPAPGRSDRGGATGSAKVSGSCRDVSLRIVWSAADGFKHAG